MQVPLINLLPKKEQHTLYQKIAHEKAIHFVLLLALCMAIFALILFSAKLSLNYEKNILQKQIQSIESSNLIQNIKGNQNKILAFNKILTKVKSLGLDGSDLTNQLQKLVFLLPEDIIFKSLSIEQDKVDIVGFAKTRSVLKEFKAIIEKELMVKEITFPLSNLESSKDIDFTMSYKFNRGEGLR